MNAGMGEQFMKLWYPMITTIASVWACELVLQWPSSPDQKNMNESYMY